MIPRANGDLFIFTPIREFLSKTFFQLKHGVALHHELEVLLKAGLTLVETLRSATSLAPHHLGYKDRGEIKPGKRVDLVLISGDPTKDISAINNIQAVWIKGVHVRKSN